MIATALPAFTFIEAWTAALCRASVEGAIAIALVWLVCRAIPRLSPNVRCWLWRLALLKMVLALIPLGSIDLPILPRAWTGEQAIAPSSSTAAATPAANAEHANIVASDSPANVDGGRAQASSGVAPLLSSSAAAASKRSGAWIALTILFFTWLAVVTVFAATVILRVRGARRWRRDWQLVKDRDVLTLNERLAAELRLFQPPILFEAENCESPAVFGAVRTAVVLPSPLLRQSTPAELRLILAHEMAHIRRWDLLGNWFSTLVSGAFFFHPLVWLALRESRLSQEMACDELAVRQPDVSVADYGRLLVDLAARSPKSAPAVAAVGVVESFHIFLKRRLSAMRTFGTKSPRLFLLSWCIATVAVCGLLPWRLVAQTEDDEKKEEKAAAAEQKINIKSASGEYTAVVDRVRREDNRRITMVQTGFPPFAGKGNQHTETKTFPGGQASTSTATMGGASGGVFRVPNLVLDVGVTSKRTDKKHQIVCTPIGKVKAIDDQDREADSEDSPGWVRTELEGVEYRRGPGRTALHIALADGDPPAKYLKSVDGELLVAEASIAQMAFQGKELARPSKKTVNGTTVKLEKVAQSSEGIDVKLSAAPPKSQGNADPMANPMEHLQRSMMASAPGRVAVVIEDSDGEMHASTGQSSQSGGSSGNSSSNSSSGSWSGGGSSSGGSWGSSRPNGRRGGNFSSNDSTPGQTFHFEALPEGVKIKAVHCKVTDFLEPPKTVPYHFKNVQLP
jgi:beta-lactamase regulating signal transducer with metallopeptidase domain